MINRPILPAINAINALMSIRLPTLVVALLLTTPSLAQAVNSPNISCTNDITSRFAQNNQKTTFQNKQIKNEQHFQSEQQRLIGCMLSQLQQYQQKQHPARQRYLAYKAQAWLNYANYKDSVNSKTSTDRYALQTASKILEALVNGTDEQVNLTPDIPSTSALMRPDLWATLQALKESGGIMLAPHELAFSEVGLIWAATEHCERGWRQSGPHFRMSERWLEQAREAYINAHDSKTNVALEERINYYFKQYAPLDTGHDKCQGQVWPNSAQNLSKKTSNRESLLKKELNSTLITQPMTKVTSIEALQIEIIRTLSAAQSRPNVTPLSVMPAPLISTPIPMPLPTVTYNIRQ